MEPQIHLTSSSRIVVSGGSGFIGGSLVAWLSRLDKKVSVIDIKPLSNAIRNVHNIEMCMADICKSCGLTGILAGADIVFHVAGNSNGSLSVLDPAYDYEVNVRGTENIARAAADAGVRRFVYVSSASVYGRPTTFPMSEEHQTAPFIPYGRSKLEGERICTEMCRQKGLPAVVARPFCVYGEGENVRVSLCEVGRYLRWHWNGHAIQIVGDKIRKTRDFVSVQDCVAGLVHVAGKGTIGEVYNIGSCRETSMLDLVQLIETVTSKSAHIKEIPRITDDTYRLVADITKLENLGYRPQVTLLEGVRQMLSDPAELQQVPTTMTIFSPDQIAETFESSAHHADAETGTT